MRKFLIPFILIGLSALSCTDLVERPEAEATPENFFVNEKSVEPIIVRAYAPLRQYTWNYWNISEASSDEMQSIFHESYWWIPLDNHVFLPTHELINNFWFESYTAIKECNSALVVLVTIPDRIATKPKFVAEVRALRAFYYYLLLDMFGNVPIITEANNTNPALAQATRREVFEFCERELKAALPTLPETAPTGRVTKGVALALLNKLYLNAEIFSGTARWADCIATADAVIQSGHYSLEPNYYDNFKLNNETSKEAIFLVQFSRTIDLGWPNQNFYMRSLHYNQMPASPWNGFATITEVYDAFNSDDVRRQAIWIGQQYSILQWPKASQTGTPLNDRTGRPLIFTKTLGPQWGPENQGARVVKYEPDLQAPGGQGENDYLIFRYSDVLLAKAEACLRVGRTAEALELVNQVRRRAFPTQSGERKTLTLTDIYNERLFEFYWEGFRRQDMIRFGTFWDAYTNKKDTRAGRNTTILMPIPSAALAQNPNLKQNPGY
ncbi:MAG: RagB/SusD family nutrient uptake outer membrane protein [Cytophagales bacterium]|nr:MAG: RagB/SusD family nutrient uptake outer membrane protein [Cytophagales bacterium]